MRKLTALSRMDPRKYPPGHQPAPLVPRGRASSRVGNKTTDICPGERGPVYSNVPPVIPEAKEGNTSDNDESDCSC